MKTVARYGDVVGKSTDVGSLGSALNGGIAVEAPPVGGVIPEPTIP